MNRRTLFATAAAAAFVAVIAQPGEAQQKTRALAQSAVAQAQQQHPQVIAEFGGELTGTRGDYVRNVGARVTAQSNVAGGASAFRVTTLNSPVMNAFAVPGGYLYITRQLLALMNDEAEVASVLGHEAGHVDARHSQARQRANIFSQLAAVLAGVVTGSGDLARVLGQGAQIWALSYSRGQELEADALGIRYMA
ncbi:MAG: M48 family metalloprotease, partial [Sphingosinicella sp.]